MTVKNRDQIGWINCPMCETRGTVHKCAVGRGKRAEALYWRCNCGTIQPWTPAGQAYLKKNMTGMEPVKPEPETAPEQVDAGAGDEYQPGAVADTKPAKRGFLAGFLDDEDDDA